MRDFKLSDLKPFMYIELRNGFRALVVIFSDSGKPKLGFDFVGDGFVMIPSEFNEDLTHKENPNCDIVEVYGYARLIGEAHLFCGFPRPSERFPFKSSRPLIWKRDTLKL